MNATPPLALSPAAVPALGNATAPAMGNMTDILDIKAPFLPPAPFPWAWSLGILVGILLAALGFWLWRRSRHERPGPPPPPPHEVALEELERLTGTMNELDDREFAFALSAIARRYVEGRFGFPALEMTVEELSPRLDELDLPDDLGKEVKHLERQAEPVKFGGLRGQDRRAQMELVHRLVERTQERPEDDEAKEPKA